MNQKFEELKLRAVREANVEHIAFDNMSQTDIRILGDIAVEEKFAELIVRECMDVVLDKDGKEWAGYVHVCCEESAGMIKKHFGVE